MTHDPTPIRFTPGKSGYYRDDSKTKPTGLAGNKSFDKVMSQNDRNGGSKGDKKPIKTDEEHDELTEEMAIQEQEEAVPQGPVSLFDMSKTQMAKSHKPVFKSDKDQLAAPSLVNQEKKANSRETVDESDDIAIEPEHIGQASEPSKKSELPSRPFDLLASASREMTPTEKTIAQKNKASARFSQEQPDLAAINPMAAVARPDVSINLNTKAEAALPPLKSIQELINLMVKEAQSLESEGKTDTTISLKYPPIFEGAQLTVTSFDSAKGEFNISFANLTQAAQQLVNNADNRANLLLSLEQKGYHVHILTASTIDDQRIYASNVEDTHRDRGQGQGQARDGQNRQSPNDEEQT